MEAATASGAPLLNRDGANPIAPTPQAPVREAIDGIAQCGCCNRFPLVGEQVVRHAASGRRGDAWVCGECEAAGKARRFGPVDAIARVRSFGGAMNVRRLA